MDRRTGYETTNAVYEFIVRYLEQYRYPPSVRDIAEGVSLASTSTVHFHIRRLIDEGRLETDAPPGSPRALRVSGYKFRKVG